MLFHPSTPASVQPQVRHEVRDLAFRRRVLRMTVLGPNLYARERADRDDVPVYARIRAQRCGDQEPPLCVARDLFGVRKDVADEAPVGVVLAGSGIELAAELRPGL